MTTLGRAPRAGLAAEAALAFAAGAATFWFAGAALAGLHSDPVVALLGAAFVVVLIAVARTLGVAYAVPVGMAGILAYDWFYVAPTHAYEFPDTANLVELIIYVGAGVLIGQVGADAVRRAKRSEGARTAIAAEQAALRRVATLVARGVPASDVFAAVAAESGQLLGVHSTHMARFEADGTAIGVSSWSPGGTHMRPGTRTPLDDTSVMGLVREERAPGARRRLRGCFCGRRRHDRGDEHPLVGRSADRRRRRALGRDRGLVRRRPVASGGHRVAPLGVHRARGHGDLEHGGPRRGAVPRG